MGKITVLCENCGRSVLKWPKDLRDCKHHFCSKKCAYEWRKTHYRKPCNFKDVWFRCEFCSKTFHRSPANVKNRKHIFCSVECYNKYYRQELICPTCGRQFTRSKSRVRGRLSFCSRECMLKFQVGERHPNYKRIKRRCLNCGAVFEVRRNDRKKFCSKTCFNKFEGKVRNGNKNPNWKPKVVKKCETCGRKFQSYPSNMKRRFCSWRCWLEWLRNIRKISPDNRRKMLASLAKRPTRPERKLMEIIRKNNLTLKYVGNGECIIGGLNPDFIDEKHKLIVEVFGKYWHNPKNSRKTQWEIVRRAIFMKFGYKMCVIWEDEVDNEKSVLEKLASVAFD